MKTRESVDLPTKKRPASSARGTLLKRLYKIASNRKTPVAIQAQVERVIAGIEGTIGKPRHGGSKPA